MSSPETKFRAGAVSATVWKNEREINEQLRVVFNVNIERNYRDRDDNWQTTNSFNLNDLPKVALVAQKAYEYIVLKEQDSGQQPASGDDDIPF